MKESKFTSLEDSDEKWKTTIYARMLVENTVEEEKLTEEDLMKIFNVDENKLRSMYLQARFYFE